MPLPSILQPLKCIPGQDIMGCSLLCGVLFPRW